jgi:hypothetical protein
MKLSGKSITSFWFVCATIAVCVCVPGEDVKKQRPAISIKMSDFGNNLSLAGKPKKNKCLRETTA